MFCHGFLPPCCRESQTKNFKKTLSITLTKTAYFPFSRFITLYFCFFARKEANFPFDCQKVGRDHQSKTGGMFASLTLPTF